MMGKGLSFECMSLNTRDINMKEPYQVKRYSQRHVDDIVKNWDIVRFNLPKVANVEDGSYICFDGQHTISAAKAMNNGKDMYIKCMVYHGLTREQVAYYFATQEWFKVHVKKTDELETLNGNKYDTTHMADMIATAELAGVHIAFNGTANGKTCLAVVRCKRIYDQYGAEHFATTLKTILDSWGECKSVLDGRIVGAVSRLIATHKPFDMKRFHKKVGSKTSPEKLINNSLISLSKKDTVYNQIELLYNGR